MATEYQYANETPPRSGYTWAIDSTTTVASTTTPTAWVGRYVTVVADQATHVLFASTSGITASATNRTGTGVFARLPAGVPMRLRLDGTDTWIHHAAVATSILRLWVSSP